MFKITFVILSALLIIVPFILFVWLFVSLIRYLDKKREKL